MGKVHLSPALHCSASRKTLVNIFLQIPRPRSCFAEAPGHSTLPFAFNLLQSVGELCAAQDKPLPILVIHDAHVLVGLGKHGNAYYQMMMHSLEVGRVVFYLLLCDVFAVL